MKKLTLLSVILLFGSSLALATSMRHLHTERLSANSPPGLHQQHMMPHGLQKQNKTPAGWSKGEKRGWHKTHYWDDNHHHHYRHHHHHHMNKVKVHPHVNVKTDVD